MLHKRSSLGSRKVSPPQPTCMSPDQKASYLADLRSNRPSRPTGSRPLPVRPSLPAQDENIPPRAGSALSLRSPNEKLPEQSVISKEQEPTHRASMPTSNSYPSLSSQKGRPLVPSPNHAVRKVSPPAAAAGKSYKESVGRVKEREEAHALREALETLDQEGDEQRIHDAAKQEAADLVWRHRNPQLAEAEKTTAYRNPDLSKQKYGELQPAKKDQKPAESDTKPNPRSASGESTSSQDSKRHRLPWLKKRPKAEQSTPQPKVETRKDTNVNMQKESQRTSGNRHVSSGSSKGVFRNPHDEIYEEVEEMELTTCPASQEVLALKSRESSSFPQGSRPLPEKSYTMPLPDKKKVDRFEIWRNPPTQSRNAAYTASRALPQLPSEEDETDNTDSPGTRALEIRSEDIRAATSMRKSDRSPKLPTPTAVSDRPGRPIVSFDPRWKPGTESPRNSLDIERPQVRNDGAVSYPVTPSPPTPEITIMEVPTINVTDQTSHVSKSTRPLPQINLPDDSSSRLSTPSVEASDHNQTRPLPQLNLPGDAPTKPLVPAINIEDEKPERRPLPSVNVQLNRPATRPLPSHTQSSPSKLPPTVQTQSELAARVPWLSRAPTTTSKSVVTCGACSLPISGRIVTASGASTKSQKARFHPECFTCHHCSTGLECVSFYPEPENARLERLQAALPHLDSEDPQIHALAQSNEDLHFFCHLDYHELFSPRCHSCKTPIEGAVVLALGRHYHPDHFFCAECGDPFSQELPFVEHNSYPYCVRCHTKRTSARCRACKQQILNDMTIEALGGKWHDECFVCCDCGGDFGEEGRFFVREIELELTEKEKRKGYGPKIEERAACQACEERRVKNVNLFL